MADSDQPPQAQAGSARRTVDLAQRQLPTASDHNPWAAEAALEAHLRRQQQEALVAVQALEQERLRQLPP